MNNNIKVSSDLRRIFTFFPKHKLVCLVGPSGAGKSSIFKYLDTEGGSRVIPTLKTRPKRPGKEEPESRFIPYKKFEKLSSTQFFYSFQYDGHWYAAKWRDLFQRLQNGSVMVFMNTEAALVLKKQYPESVQTIFITPSESQDEALKILAERMAARGNISKDSLKKC
jgi:guanylate kinase